MSKNILFLLADDLAAKQVFRSADSPVRPAFSELMRRGTSFTQVISSATMTTQCVASIFSGCYSFLNGVRALRGDVLLPSVPTLAQELQKNGYHTQALVTGPLWEGTGLERGFDGYEYCQPSAALATHWRDRIQALMDPASTGRPWFIYAHFYDMHAPRVVAPEFNRPSFGATVYERAASTLDRRFAEILEQVDWDDTIVVLHADHGELYPDSRWLELRERVWQDYVLGKKPWLMRMGVKRDPMISTWTKLKRSTRMGHGFNLSEGLVRVPLVIIGAPAMPSGYVVPEQVRQVDLMPTILDLVGIRPPPGISGRSLLPIVRGQETGPRPAYMETYGFGRDPNFFMRGIRMPEWKYIDSPTDRRVKPQLYALNSSSHETDNLIHARPEIAAEMRKLMEQETTLVAGTHEGEPWTPEEANLVEDRLRDLGYF